MKYFGKFLIEKNLIDQKVLVDVLIEQMKRMPLLCDVARESSLLNDEQILQILEIQDKENLSFKEACSKIGLWSNEIALAFEKEIEKVRPPLGQILLEKKSISVKDLTKALDDFLSKDENLVIGQESVAESHPAEVIKETSLEQAPAEQTTQEESAGSGSFLDQNLDEDHLLPINHDIYNETKDFFSGEKLDSTVQKFEALVAFEGSEDEFTNSLKAILEDVHTLKGVCVCSKLLLTGKIVDFLERATLAILKSKNFDPMIMHQYSFIGTSSLSTVKKIHETVEQDGDEKSFYNVKKDLVVTVLSTLKDFIQEVA